MRRRAGSLDVSSIARSRRSGAEQGVAFDVHDGRDQRAPWRAVERRSGRVDGNTPVLLPVSSTLPAGLDGNGPLRGDDAFEATAQGLLVGLDLNDHLIAALTHLLECFFLGRQSLLLSLSFEGVEIGVGIAAEAGTLGARLPPDVEGSA